jgi:hypothetical protein
VSQLLVALYNDTEIDIRFVNKEHAGDNKIVYRQSVLIPHSPPHYNIPDNSDSAKYFDQHHMELQDAHGRVLFSFWDDDHEDFLIKCCQGVDWKNTTMLMPNTPSGNDKNVMVVIRTERGDPIKYAVFAMPANVIG